MNTSDLSELRDIYRGLTAVISLRTRCMLDNFEEDVDAWDPAAVVLATTEARLLTRLGVLVRDGGELPVLEEAA